MSRAFLCGGVFGAVVVLAGIGLLDGRHVAPVKDVDRPMTAVDRETVLGYVQRGEAVIPELRERLRSTDPATRRCAREALARITGQWGSEGDGIVWKRSLAEALGRGRPILLLQLFGKFDEEFC